MNGGDHGVIRQDTIQPDYPDPLGAAFSFAFRHPSSVFCVPQNGFRSPQ